MEAGIGGLWWSQTYPESRLTRRPSTTRSPTNDAGLEQAYPVGEEYGRYLSELPRSTSHDRRHFNSESLR